MSQDSKLSRARSKLRKKKKTPTESKSEVQARLFTELNKQGHGLSDDFLLEKYSVLLSRMVTGRASIGSMSSLFNKFKQEQIVSGRVDALFKLSSPEKYVVTLKGASFKNREFVKETKFIAFKRDATVYVCPHKGRRFPLTSSTLVFGALISCVKLPADVRKWDKTWVNELFSIKYVLNLETDATRKGSISRLVSSGIKALPELMTINTRPSKKQRLTLTKKNNPISNNLQEVGNQHPPAIATKLYKY